MSDKKRRGKAGIPLPVAARGGRDVSEKYSGYRGKRREQENNKIKKVTQLSGF